jgi:hypothetical protein
MAKNLVRFEGWPMGWDASAPGTVGALFGVESPCSDSLTLCDPVSPSDWTVSFLPKVPMHQVDLT